MASLRKMSFTKACPECVNIHLFLKKLWRVAEAQNVERFFSLPLNREFIGEKAEIQPKVQASLLRRLEIHAIFVFFLERIGKRTILYGLIVRFAIGSAMEDTSSSRRPVLLDLAEDLVHEDYPTNAEFVQNKPTRPSYHADAMQAPPCIIRSLKQGGLNIIDDFLSFSQVRSSKSLR